MRRSTAAAIGTLTGAALIVGVRLSVQPPAAPVVAQAPLDLADSDTSGKPSTSASPSASKKADAKKPAVDKEAVKSPFKDGVFKGKASNNPYGTIQVSIRVTDGKISAAQASYPLTGDSATINPPAIASLKQQTLTAKTADDVNAVSGATYTSKSYKESLQAALDAAKA
jgi:uncharacterized protein with FMN-binding domain